MSKEIFEIICMYPDEYTDFYINIIWINRVIHWVYRVFFLFLVYMTMDMSKN